jgi:hypothetical protein
VYYLTPIPTSILKEKHYDVGLTNLFQIYRHLVVEFDNQFLFKAFLLAVGNQIRETLQRERTNNLYYWWRGNVAGGKLHFYDNSTSYKASLFDNRGRAQLARNLAVDLFRVLELYTTAGIYKNFLENADCTLHDPNFDQYLFELPADASSIPIDEIPIPKPSFKVENTREEINEKISETKRNQRGDVSPGKHAKMDAAAQRKRDQRNRKKGKIALYRFVSD